jgi:hypothetical protein
VTNRNLRKTPGCIPTPPKPGKPTTLRHDLADGIADDDDWATARPRDDLIGLYGLGDEDAVHFDLTKIGRRRIRDCGAELVIELGDDVHLRIVASPV